MKPTPPHYRTVLAALESITAVRTREERDAARELISERGYAVRWTQAQGVRVHATIEQWDAGTGYTVAQWRARGRA